MQHGDALGQAQRGIHVVLDHHDGDVARIWSSMPAPSAVRPVTSGERLSSRAPSLLRERHGQARAAAARHRKSAGDDPLGAVAEADALSAFRALS